MTQATQTLTLTDFLLARIAEDAEAAMNYSRFEIRDGIPGSYAIPERILAECEAKRRIVARHRPWDLGSCSGCGGVESSFPHRYAECPDLRALAVVYADHPDYREGWRP